MKQDYPYGLSLTLASTAIIVLGYLVFLGLDFHYEGRLLLPSVLAVGGMLVLAYCLWVMCKSKRTRQWRVGRPKETIALVVALAVMVMGSIPLGRFVKVWDEEEEMRIGVNETVSAIRNISDDYIAYAHERIERYNDPLLTSGERDNARKSLQHRLLPEGMTQVLELRNSWLDGLDDVSVWNIYTPRNIHYIVDTGQQWADELVRLSSTIYQGEEAAPFERPRLQDRLSRYERDYTQLEAPDWRGILLCLALIALYLTPYWMARRPRTGERSQ